MTVWVPVLVPEEDLLDVATWIAGRLVDREMLGNPAAGPHPVLVIRAAPPGDPTADRAALALAAHATWNRDDLRRLARGETATTRRWSRAIDVCAEHVGEFFTTERLAAATGMGVTEWRDAQRKLGRHMRGHYPMAREWPLASIRGDEVSVAITAPQAVLWRAVRAEPRPVSLARD